MEGDNYMRDMVEELNNMDIEWLFGNSIEMRYKTTYQTAEDSNYNRARIQYQLMAETVGLNIREDSKGGDPY